MAQLQVDRGGGSQRPEGATKISFRMALNEALAQEMRRDEKIIILGEDVSGGMGAPGEQDTWGGVLGVTKGLMPEFGRERVMDTPLQESAIMGAAIGAAQNGLRPVGELMFIGFIGVCFDQLLNQMPKFRYMFGGKVTTPVTIRTVYGAGLRIAAQHAQSLHSMITHIPGLKVVMPSNPLRRQGPADPVDPRRRPGDVLRAHRHVRRRGRGAGGALHHPLRRGQPDPRG